MHQSGLLTYFLTPLMLCVLVLYISGETYSLRSTLNDGFFEKLFMAVLIFSQSFCQKSAEKKSPQKCFLFWCLVWGSNPGFTSNKPTHYLLDYGDARPITNLAEKTLLTKVKPGKQNLIVQIGTNILQVCKRSVFNSL